MHARLSQDKMKCLSDDCDPGETAWSDRKGQVALTGVRMEGTLCNERCWWHWSHESNGCLHYPGC